MTTTHWLYPTNRNRQCWVGRAPEDVLAPGNVRARERTNADGSASWRLNSGFRTMRPGDMVWLYAAGEQVIYAAAQALQVRFDETEQKWLVDVAWCHAATDQLEREAIPRANFGQIPQSVQRAGEATSAVLEQWLGAHGVQPPQ